jgi:antitoxin CptB
MPPIAAAAAPLAERELARLRWRCRRGLLENDLLLTRFLDARGAALTQREAALLDALLDLPDDALLAALCGSGDADAAALATARTLGI